MEIASVIKNVFPSEEIEFYFIPSHGSAAARGALYNVYRTYREELGIVGLAQLRPKRKNETTGTEVEIEAGTEEDQQNDLQESLEFLKHHTDPKSDILVHWVNSRGERENMLAAMSNIEYINHFPVLQMGNGFEWILMDFDAKYPDAPKILECWPSFASKILAFAKSCRNKSENLKTLLNDSDTATNPMIMAMIVLPLILKTTTKRMSKLKPKTTPEPAEARKGVKKTFRSSKPEIAVDFIQRFMVIFLT